MGYQSGFDYRVPIHDKSVLFQGDDDEEPSSRRHAPEHGLSGSEEEGSGKNFAILWILYYFPEDNFIVNEGDGEQRKKRRHHKRDMNLPEGWADLNLAGYCIHF